MLSESDKVFILENIEKNVDWLVAQTGRPKKDVEKFVGENKKENKVAQRLAKKMSSKKGTTIMTGGASEILDEVKRTTKKETPPHIQKIRPEEPTY